MLRATESDKRPRFAPPAKLTATPERHGQDHFLHRRRMPFAQEVGRGYCVHGERTCKVPGMTTTSAPQAPTMTATATGHLLIRCDEWARLYALDADDTHKDLTRYVEGAYYAGEPVGDAWHLPVDGEPIRLTVGGIRTPFDESDYASQIVAFYHPVTREAVARVRFRIDGRA